ncbi:MAG: nitroreductase [Alphaproteobacteria bacterium]|nr:nitroreductase [Alphaproteobacteria bacterium]
MPATALAALLDRRSTAVKDLSEPAPDAAQLETILRIATRVPDHGKLCPWRIVVLRGEGALALGAIAADVFARTNPEATEAQIAAEHTRFARAPLCLAVVSTPIAGSKPVWEQQLSVGAVCMNILHAAHALGFGGKWLTEWVAYEATILDALLGAAPSFVKGEEAPRIAGFIYIGTRIAETPERERPAPEVVVGVFGSDAP